MDTRHETRVLIAGSRTASPAMLAYARRVVQRAAVLGYTVMVGDNPHGVDNAVVQECRRLRMPVIVAGIGNFPRNGGSWQGTYLKIAHDLYCGMDGRLLDGYSVRDRWLVDNAHIGIFVWNGTSRGTKAGYDYACERGKTAHLIRFGEAVGR